jgi:hypothetical protein
MVANPGFNVGRWNGNTYARVRTQNERRREVRLKFADGRVVHIDGELAYFGGGAAGASAKGFAEISVKSEPEHLPDAEAG